jgi:hypothetical protein
MPVLLLQVLRVCWLLVIALFVWIVSVEVVVLASLDPGPRRSAKRTVGYRLAINHYLRRECRFQRCAEKWETLRKCARLNRPMWAMVLA